MKTIEEKIIEEIDKKGYSKTFVIKKLGMTATGFNQMLKNQSISLKRFLEISELLELHPNYFISGSVNEEFQKNNQEDSKGNLSINDLKKENVFLKKQIDRLTFSIESISRTIIEK